MIDWSDLILVMEKSHKTHLLEHFDNIPELINLDIPDDYQFMDSDLIEILKLKTQGLIDGQD